MAKTNRADQMAAIIADRGVSRTTTWGGMSAGAAVKVKGWQGEFRFLGARLDGEGNVRWLDLYGPVGIDGKSVTGMLRSALPDRVSPLTRPVRRAKVKT